MLQMIFLTDISNFIHLKNSNNSIFQSRYFKLISCILDLVSNQELKQLLESCDLIQEFIKHYKSHKGIFKFLKIENKGFIQLFIPKIRYVFPK